MDNKRISFGRIPSVIDIPNLLGIQTETFEDFVQLDTIDPEGTLTYSDPYILRLDLTWRDKKNNSLSCKITFDIWNDRNVTNVQLN